MSSDPLDALDNASQQIRSVHEAAERAAEQIGSDGERLRESGADRGSAAMVDLADALIARTDAIRRECESLSEMLERANRLARPLDSDQPSLTGSDGRQTFGRRFLRRDRTPSSEGRR